MKKLTSHQNDPKILVGCEYSGVVREAFRTRGFNAYSCDLLDSDVPSKYHLKCDIMTILEDKWDLAVFFPPCTHLASSGAKWFDEKRKDGRQQAGIKFFLDLYNCPIPRICIENPIGIMSTELRKPDQIIQPYFFGDPFKKSTCLWLKNLPKLEPTNIVKPGPQHVTKSGKSMPAWYNIPPIADRWKIRSKTFQGLADAMADQFGNYLIKEKK